MFYVVFDSLVIMTDNQKALIVLMIIDGIMMMILIVILIMITIRIIIRIIMKVVETRWISIMILMINHSH